MQSFVIVPGHLTHLSTVREAAGHSMESLEKEGLSSEDPRPKFVPELNARGQRRCCTEHVLRRQYCIRHSISLESI